MGFMPDEIRIRGDFVTTLHPFNEGLMLLVTAENLDGSDIGFIKIYLYKFNNGELDCGLDTFYFSTSQEAEIFLKQLPTMTAVDYLAKSLNVPPPIY